jgi:hypothetical protein
MDEVPGGCLEFLGGLGLVVLVFVIVVLVVG